MGIWSNLVGSVQEANEQAHGERLKKGLESTISLMTAMDGGVRVYAISKFMDKREKLRLNMVNWSRDGRLKIGRTLQDEARKRFDLDQAESYALWLAGAWIESSVRNSSQAEYVHHFIEELARPS